MVIPKSKRKQRQFFIELNYLQKVDFEKAKRLINKGDISSVVRGVEVLMNKPRTTSKKNVIHYHLDSWLEALHDRADVLLEELRDKTIKEIGSFPHPEVLTLEEKEDLWLKTLPEEIRLDLSSPLEDFHDSLEDEGHSIDYGTPSKQDFELEDEEWDATYQAAYGTKVIEFQEDHN